MSLDVERHRLWSAFEVLQNHWDEAQRGWRDTVKKEFAERFFLPIEPSVRKVMDAMDQAIHQVTTMRQACGVDNQA